MDKTLESYTVNRIILGVENRLSSARQDVFNTNRSRPLLFELDSKHKKETPPDPNDRRCRDVSIELIQGRAFQWTA